jgi:hypothetical protein
MKVEPWIETFTGKRFNVMQPKAEDICIEDVAHALALQCRFNGHSRVPLSIAEHCVRVSWLVEKLGGTFEERKWGLCHDAGEAFLGDLPRPIKHGTQAGFLFGSLEDGIMLAVCERFGLPPDEPLIVREADMVMLATERRDLMIQIDGWGDLPEPLGETILPWTWKRAEREFLYEYALLVNGASNGEWA